MDYTFERLLPVLAIRNSVIFPGLALPLRVGRKKSIAAIEQAQKEGSWILTVSQKPDSLSPPKNGNGSPEAKIDDLYRIGTLGKIEKIRGNSDDGYQIIVRGLARFKVTQYQETDGVIFAQAEQYKDLHDVEPKTEEALLESLKGTAQAILALVPSDTDQLAELVRGIDDPVYLTNLCASNLEIPLAKKQELLEMVSIKNRALTLLELMQTQKDALEVQSDIREKLSHRLGKTQREAILREQLRTIREELGEGEEAGSNDDYRKRIDDAKMPAEVKKTALEELKRLESLGSSSPETHVIRNYLELLCSMPWEKGSSESEIDLEAARKSLNEDHYGLDRIKKRIIEHLAVMKLKKGARGSILLFVGPPGVGKTSLGQSIAKALGRKFVRGSLGGVRDDAEIRGHRRTYIGAMPGRIIQGIKRAGENNPVFMLDEIDKLARSFQGDPGSALLEVLDPEQNHTFLDHYLDVPFDLSKVFFIATANTLDSIPGPLLDRMEVIDLSGYTTAEKLHIAKNHLIPKQLAEYGLETSQLEIGDETLLRMITHYTRESGVRDLQRKIAALCRASTEKVLAKAAVLPVKMTSSDLEEVLGLERFTPEVAERIVPPGVVTGLAWTPQGGEILFIEASLMPGSGKLILTGQLGDVMKESAQIALSLVRSRLSSLIPDGFAGSGGANGGSVFDRQDVHIHVPAGAIPKDGPSAGIALFTTLASLFTGRSVHSKLAMTGEITLRGAVMPVGGIKEKVIGAHRAGIDHIILSRRNQKDLRDVPEEVKSQIRFDFVDSAAEVLKLALGLDMEIALPLMHSTVVTHPGSSPAVA
ncbi:MAG: endopeptidase La [Methylotenera sp.]|nr:endopeptidase La [Oligoflexia bacterium]